MPFRTQPQPQPQPSNAAPSASEAPSRAGARAIAIGRVALLASIAACLVQQPAAAERADRDKPINIEADSMKYDDLKQINVFTGNVTMTKGTIVIRGDRLVLRQDPEGYQYGTAFGSPATFRQKRDGVAQYIVGQGQQLDYDGKTETMKFQQRANLKRLESDRVTDEIHGNLIVYDSRTEFFTVESGGPASATPENPGGRVRVVIQPKSAEPQPPSTPTTLTPARQLDSPRK